MTSPDRRLLRPLVTAVLVALWGAFVRDARVSVDASSAADRIGAATAMYHWLFVPLTLGMVWLLIVEVWLMASAAARRSRIRADPGSKPTEGERDMPDCPGLKIVWWLLVGVLLVGLAIMDGHDRGVGTLLPFVGRNDVERRVVNNTVGPHRDGNPVGFVPGGGAIFAAWPLAYRTRR